MDSLGAHVILYLDYDGALHGDELYRTKNGIMRKGSWNLFEHAVILVEALKPCPDVGIILSTSLVRELGFKQSEELFIAGVTSQGD